MRQKEGIKPIDPYDDSVRRELCSEKLTVLVCTVSLYCSTVWQFLYERHSISTYHDLAFTPNYVSYAFNSFLFSFCCFKLHLFKETPLLFSLFLYIFCFVKCGHFLNFVI